MACLLRTQGVRNLLPHFAFGKTGRTGAPQSAAKKIFVKVQLCRTFTPLPRDSCPEPPLPCRGEGVIAPGFFGTGGVSKGGQRPP